MSQKQAKGFSVGRATMLAHFDQCSLSSGWSPSKNSMKHYSAVMLNCATSHSCYSFGSSESLSHLDFWLQTLVHSQHNCSEAGQSKVDRNQAANCAEIQLKWRILSHHPLMYSVKKHVCAEIKTLSPVSFFRLMGGELADGGPCLSVIYNQACYPRLPLSCHIYINHSKDSSLCFLCLL